MENAAIRNFHKAPNMGLELRNQFLCIVESLCSENGLYLRADLRYHLLHCLLHHQLAIYKTPQKFKGVSFALHRMNDDDMFLSNIKNPPYLPCPTGALWIDKQPCNSGSFLSCSATCNIRNYYADQSSILFLYTISYPNMWSTNLLCTIFKRNSQQQHGTSAWINIQIGIHSCQQDHMTVNISIVGRASFSN